MHTCAYHTLIPLPPLQQCVPVFFTNSCTHMSTAHSFPSPPLAMHTKGWKLPGLPEKFLRKVSVRVRGICHSRVRVRLGRACLLCGRPAVLCCDGCKCMHVPRRANVHMHTHPQTLKYSNMTLTRAKTYSHTGHGDLLNHHT